MAKKKKGKSFNSSSSDSIKSNSGAGDNGAGGNGGETAAAAALPDVESLSVKQLKAELAALGADFSHCVEKKEMMELLKKTRANADPAKLAEVAQQQKPAAAAAAAAAAESKKSSPPRSSSTGGGSSSSVGGGSGPAKRAKIRDGNVRVAVLFDPDNDGPREVARFIQEFFQNTPECAGAASGTAPASVAWVFDEAMREPLEKMKLPEQLADFDSWFQVLFVDAARGGQCSSWTAAVPLGEPAPGTAGLLVRGLTDPATGRRLPPRYPPAINVLFDGARRCCDPTHVVVRRRGGFFGPRWLTRCCLRPTDPAAAYLAPTGGLVVLDVEEHRAQFPKLADAANPVAQLVPHSLTPPGAWYYWLLKAYGQHTVTLPQSHEAPDADRIMEICEDDQLPQ